eukprot:TRINITY_DN62971_c0_g1_i1.p1 TRINITY_DN62971_c0_g1~~TRINITY_DN62971_c0_g1_i1.p1  ORF type:complete len:566 (-),score=76.21 TRINITY_DN62971_c0_g1_i1:148-1845(-)
MALTRLVYSLSFIAALWQRMVLVDGLDDESQCTAQSCEPKASGEPSDTSGLLQIKQMPEKKPVLDRITIGAGKFFAGGVEVLPLGGNYVVKAQPYYPPEHIVRQNAKEMAAGAASMAYKPSDGRKVVPAVRLGAYFEGAMPNEPGVFDPQWQKRLEATVKAFADEGVYVILDIHQDAIATTNGGAGLPWWMTAMMQDTAGSVPGCFLCSSRDSYITTPEHPLRSIQVPFPLNDILAKAGVTIPQVKIVNNTDPWLAYSVGGNAGDPRSMNVGNINMRANNNDAAWGAGILTLVQQVQNVAWRFYRAPKYAQERKMFFEPYLAFVRYLSGVWKDNANVIGIDLFNEPPLGGLPDLLEVEKLRTNLFDFYAAVLQDLDSLPEGSQPPAIIEDVGGKALNPEIEAIAQLLNFDGIDERARNKLEQWSAKGKLIYEFHWYPQNQTLASLKDSMHGARLVTSLIGNPPIYLGEYWTSQASTTASWLSVASELGCGAVTYWQNVDSKYTKQGGWYIYPKGIPSNLFDFTSADNVDWNAWYKYEATVRDGTYWGAYVCGAAGGTMNVLRLVK